MPYADFAYRVASCSLQVVLVDSLLYQVCISPPLWQCPGTESALLAGVFGHQL